MTITMSQNIEALAGALVKAQSTLKPAIKDSVNPFFDSKYADLAAVMDACREALTANGLAVSQHVDLEGDAVGVTTMLLHTSGQWLASRAAAKPAKVDPQGVGSAVTYLRRYGLMAVVGIAVEDDDGEAATGRGTKPGQRKTPSPEDAPPVPLADVIHQLCEEKGIEPAKVAARYGASHIEELDDAQASEAIARLRGYKPKHPDAA